MGKLHVGTNAWLSHRGLCAHRGIRKVSPEGVTLIWTLSPSCEGFRKEHVIDSVCVFFLMFSFHFYYCCCLIAREHMCLPERDRETEREREKAPSMGNGHAALPSLFSHPVRIWGTCTHMPRVFYRP